MSTEKPKKTEKDIALTIRVDADLRSAFQLAAKGQDRSVSQLIREFMRDYVKKHGQTDIFK